MGNQQQNESKRQRITESDPSPNEMLGRDKTIPTSAGVNTVLDGWIEKGSSGFQTDGHYFIITSSGNKKQLECQTIRHGLLMSVEPGYPKDRLVPAKIVIERGRHASVYPNHQSTQIINKAIIPGNKQGYVVRDYIMHPGNDDKSQTPMDLVMGSLPTKTVHKAKQKSINIFISYSHADKTLCEQLLVHLSGLVRRKIIRRWYDQCITPGGTIDPEIETHLRNSQIVMLLVSPDFLASDYCMEVELNIALEMQKRGEASVVPTILRPCDWQEEAFGKFRALPENGEPITKWKNQDEAFLDVICQTTT